MNKSEDMKRRNILKDNKSNINFSGILKQISPLYASNKKLSNIQNYFRNISNKKKKIKNKIHLNEINDGYKKLEREERRKKYLSYKDNDFSNIRRVTSKTKENTKNTSSNKDKSIYTHLLLNSYANINPLEYLPDKKIEERIKTMREKILAIFPELESEKAKEQLFENELQKKKDFLSINDSHSTKELDII